MRRLFALADVPRKEVGELLEKIAVEDYGDSRQQSRVNGMFLEQTVDIGAVTA